MIFIIAGRFKKRKLVTPKGVTTRPTLNKVRETLFNICQGEIEGATFLDLFAGSGAIGLEALSRGAASVTFVEKDRAALQALAENIKMLGVEKETNLIKSDVFKAVEHLSVFDIIFADPPYGQGFGERLLPLITKKALLKGSLFIEESSELAEPEGLVLQSIRKTGRTKLYHYNPFKFS